MGSAVTEFGNSVAHSLTIVSLLLISDSSDLIRTLAKRVSDQELSVGDQLDREQALPEAYGVRRSTVRVGLDIAQNQEGYYAIASGQSVSNELVGVRGSWKSA